jgi:hypothetical protein
MAGGCRCGGRRTSAWWTNVPQGDRLSGQLPERCGRGRYAQLHLPHRKLEHSRWTAPISAARPSVVDEPIRLSRPSRVTAWVAHIVRVSGPASRRRRTRLPIDRPLHYRGRPRICPGYEPNAPLSTRAQICRWNSTSQNAPRWAVMWGMKATARASRTGGSSRAAR